MKKHAILFPAIATTLLLSSLYLPSSLPQTVHAATSSTVSPCSDNIFWVTKTVNGKLYKRLYNGSTGEWIGDWIFVR